MTLTPAPSTGLGAQTISASETRTCATSKRGELYCWGRVSFDGMVGWRGVHPDSGWIDPRSLTGGVPVAQVSTGSLFDCVRTNTGRTLCDGWPIHGALARSNRVNAPKDVRTSKRFTAITLGRDHACGLTRDHRAYCWGWNDAGQTGVGTRADTVARPTAVVGGHRFREITAGDRHTCGITVQGATLCWGANSSGQLGRDPALHGCAPTATCMAVPMPVDVAHRYVTLSAGATHTCGILGNGVAFCWGDGFSGYTQLAKTSKPLEPTRINSSLRFRAVASGRRFTCGLADDGRVACWGSEKWLPLSRGRVTVTDESVVGNIRFRAIAAGHSHACGIGRSGRTYCWGQRDVRQRQDGLTIDASVDTTPRLVPIPNLLDEPRRVEGELDALLERSTPSRCWWEPEAHAQVAGSLRRIVSRAEDSSAAAERERQRLRLPALPADSVVTITDRAECWRAFRVYQQQRPDEATWTSNALVFRVGDRFVVYTGEVEERGYFYLVFDDRWRLVSRGWYDAFSKYSPPEAPWPAPPRGRR